MLQRDEIFYKWNSWNTIEFLSHGSNNLEERNSENWHEIFDELWWVDKKAFWFSLSINVNSSLLFGYVTLSFPKQTVMTSPNV